MRKLLRLASGLDCAHLIRHFALCLGAGVALVHPGPLRVGNAFLGLVALAAVLNFLIAFLSERAGFTKVAHALSAGSGVFGWAALAWVTGGSSSPFVAGFWLEIVLSALTFVNWGTLGVTGACLGALWAQQAIPGLPESLRTLVLQSAFLMATGLATLLLTRQWQRARGEWLRHQQDLAAARPALTTSLWTGADHLGSFAEDPAAYRSAFMGFLQALKTRITRRGYAVVVGNHLRQTTVRHLGRTFRLLEGYQLRLARPPDGRLGG